MLDVSVINVCIDISVTLCADVSVSPSLPYDWYNYRMIWHHLIMCINLRCLSLMCVLIAVSPCSVY